MVNGTFYVKPADFRFTYRCLCIFNWDWRKYFNAENITVVLYISHCIPMKVAATVADLIFSITRKKVSYFVLFDTSFLLETEETGQLFTFTVTFDKLGGL